MEWYYLKEDSSFSENWYPNDALLNRLDTIINELLRGEGPNGLAKVNDPTYLANMNKVQAEWIELKKIITEVRAGTIGINLR